VTSDTRPVPTYPDIAGKVAVVTGGSKGIGAATCRVLARNGAKLAVNGRSEAGVDAMVAELRELGAEAIGVPADCTDLGQVEGLCERVEAELGPIDILLPFAGGFDSFTPLQDTTPEEWRQVLDDNLTSTFLPLRAVVPRMIERRGGAIVTMSTNGARFLDKTLTASYVAAKAGVLALTRHAARELGPHGIRVNAIAPATVRSERIDRIMDPEAQARVAAMSPLGTMGTPEDCALAALFLVSDSAGWLTGVTLDVAGGRIML
jgi:3-oxoacyl-[acyl-carrier protein] reductase